MTIDPLRRAWGEYQRDYAFFLAAAMVYYALVSLVPLLLLLLSGLGLLLRYSDFTNAAERQVLSGVAANLGDDVSAAMSQILDGLRQASLVATAVSLVGLMATASMLFRNLRLSFRAIWKHEPPLASGSLRGMVQETFLEQAKSFALVLAAGLLWLLSLAVVSLVQWLGGLVDVPTVTETATWILVLMGPLVVVLVTFAVLFKVLPPVRMQWRHVLLPAALCAVAWYATAEIMALYGVFFGGDVGAYDVLGGLLVFMLWMNVVSQLLFFGAELCKVMARDAPLAGA